MAREEQAMSAEWLAEIRERLAVATRGPWEVEYDPDIEGVADELFVCSATSRLGAIYEPFDATFIAHARVDVPALLAEVERLRAREAALVAVVRAVAEADNSDEGVCLQICDGSYNIGDGCFEHSERCMLGQARALLASTADEQKGGGDGS